MFPFAARTHWRQDINALNKAFEGLRLQGTAVLDLTLSNPTECGFHYPAFMVNLLDSPENLKYFPDAPGMVHSRHAVANYYSRRGFRVDPNHVVLTASTSEAYSFLLRLLVDPGGKVLVPKPSYPLFQFLLEINDVAFEYYPLTYDNQWHLDLPALEAMVDAKTRAIILVNPNNPTGSYLRPEELEFLNQLCQKHDLALIVDEVFFDYAWGTEVPLSCLTNSSALTFVLGGLSKTLGLPQMKCAWIVASGPDAVLKEALGRLDIIADTFLSVNTPVQNALPVWLEQAAPIQDQIMRRVVENHQWLASHLDSHTQLLPIEGGWCAILRIPAIKSEEEWAMEFLQQDHVLVHPGYFFDFSGGVYMVLSLLPTPEVFQEAAGRLLKRLAVL